MKRYRLFLILALIGATVQSCIDETFEAVEGNEVEVTFSFNVEGSTQTRAISDGKSVDKLVYAIVTEDGKQISRNEKILENGFSSSLDMTMTVSMVKGLTYKAVFWAQSSECSAYTVSDDMTVSVDYSGASNDEKRDAFYGVSTPFTMAENQAEVILKRPFAQFNAGTHPFDWEYATGYHDFDVKKSAVMIRKVADKINLWDGTVSGSADATFSPSALPSEMLMTDVDGDGMKEEYKYLSMSYVLAGTEPTYHSVDLFFIDGNGNAVMAENSALEKVELRRNCRTDFTGQMLTDQGELNIREYIEATTVYHNITEDTTLSDKIYNMSGFDAIQFASEKGDKFTLDNIYMTGDIWTVELGEYRGAGYVLCRDKCIILCYYAVGTSQEMRGAQNEIFRKFKNTKNS